MIPIDIFTKQKNIYLFHMWNYKILKAVPKTWFHEMFVFQIHIYIASLNQSIFIVKWAGSPDPIWLIQRNKFIWRRKYAESWRKMQELRAQIQAQLKLADTLKKLGEQAEKNNLALDLDIGADLAELKANLAKFKKGRHGAGLEDIDIEQLDWVQSVQRRAIDGSSYF